METLGLEAFFVSMFYIFLLPLPLTQTQKCNLVLKIYHNFLYYFNFTLLQYLFTAVEPVMENTDPPTLQGNQGTLFET